MAAEVSGPMNGTYGGHMNHLANDYGTAVAHSQPQQHHAVNGNGASAEPERPSKLPPGEIGWFFVEQYYNNLSTTPEKLHLFYNKRSQFTCGDEEEKTMVAMGPKAIEDRIAEMEFQDAKVRVTNVDVQESGKMILVQVIGEISLKAKPQRKFTQTFVLAEQPNGYFVLNDIMRFLLDEEPVSEVADNNGTTVDEVQPPVAATLPEVPNEASKEEIAPVEAIDKKLEVLKSEENLQDLRADTPAVESAPEPVKPAETSAPPPAELESAQVETAAESLAPEAPTDPVPSPTATPQATELPATQAPTSAPAQPAAAPAPVPAKPTTWAAMFANKTPTPVVPKVQNQAKPAKAATSNLAPANATAAQAPVQSAPVTSAPIPSSTPLQDDNSVPASPGGWTNVTGHDHNRNKSRPANGQQNHVQENNNVHGYIKNVNEKVNASLLREALEARGTVAYFDVNRIKNCAFVEFPDQESFQAVVAGSPYVINGEEVTVEERRTPAGNRNFRNGPRGGRTGPDANGRLNGQGQQGRGGLQGNNQGRGGHTARGGRGGQAQGQAQGGRPRAQQ